VPQKISNFGTKTSRRSRCCQIVLLTHLTALCWHNLKFAEIAIEGESAEEVFSYWRISR
jgi:hypothetical protein